MQGDSQKRHRARDLREFSAQAAAGVKYFLNPNFEIRNKAVHSDFGLCMSD
jgi:hypothetical protein